MNKVIAITSLSLVGVLMLAVILMALIPINYNLKLQEKPSLITVHSSAGKSSVFSADGSATSKETYNKILELYNNSGSFSTLNSLFIGLWGKKVEPDRATTSQTISSLYPSGTYCIEFLYDTSQKMRNSDGSAYVWQANGEQSYKRLFVPVKSVNEVSALTYYVTDNDTATTVSFTYSAYSNQFELHKYLATLTYI